MAGETSTLPLTEVKEEENILTPAKYKQYRKTSLIEFNDAGGTNLKNMIYHTAFVSATDHDPILLTFENDYYLVVNTTNNKFAILHTIPEFKDQLKVLESKGDTSTLSSVFLMTIGILAIRTPLYFQVKKEFPVLDDVVTTVVNLTLHMDQQTLVGKVNVSNIGTDSYQNTVDYVKRHLTDFKTKDEEENMETENEMIMGGGKYNGGIFTFMSDPRQEDEYAEVIEPEHAPHSKDIPAYATSRIPGEPYPFAKAPLPEPKLYINKNATAPEKQQATQNFHEDLQRNFLYRAGPKVENLLDRTGLPMNRNLKKMTAQDIYQANETERLASMKFDHDNPIKFKNSNQQAEAVAALFDKHKLKRGINPNANPDLRPTWNSTHPVHNSERIAKIINTRPSLISTLFKDIFTFGTKFVLSYMFMHPVWSLSVLAMFVNGDLVPFIKEALNRGNEIYQIGKSTTSVVNWLTELFTGTTAATIAGIEKTAINLGLKTPDVLEIQEMGQTLTNSDLPKNSTIPFVRALENNPGSVATLASFFSMTGMIMAFNKMRGGGSGDFTEGEGEEPVDDIFLSFLTPAQVKTINDIGMNYNIYLQDVIAPRTDLELL